MWHLVSRFFSVLGARSLAPSEQLEAATLLRSTSEAKLFWAQQAADQRHGLEAARHVQEAAPEDVVAARAALLHDVGKAISRLGPVRRSCATVLARLGMPLPARWRAYVEHGPLGAALLEAGGAEELVVGFARSHHGRRPSQIEPDLWRLLQRADRA